MSETISPNTTIAQYTIVSKIGEGGMAIVFARVESRHTSCSKLLASG